MRFILQTLRTGDFLTLNMPLPTQSKAGRYTLGIPAFVCPSAQRERLDSTAVISAGQCMTRARWTREPVVSRPPEGAKSLGGRVVEVT